MNFQLPKISILMPVYNAEAYLDQTIQSILFQTFDNFEFLIIDDKSTDNSLNVIKKYKDARIKLYENEVNLGYVKSLNFLIQYTTGEYLARQDNDDISNLNRLQEQIKFLDNNPNVLLCGSNYKIFGKKNYNSNVPLTNKQIKAFLLFNNPLCHPTVLLRKSIFKKFSIDYYDENMCPSEDYALWFEISKHGEIVNLPNYLLEYRIHNSNTSYLNKKIQVEAANEVREKVFHYLLNYDLKPEQNQMINLLFNNENGVYVDDLEKIINLFKIILDQNKKIKKIDHTALELQIFSFLVRFTLNNSNLNFLNKYKYFFNYKIFKVQIIFKYILQRYSNCHFA
jgi:glycosyltransferase involved in cell wall biosynthesis